MLVKLAAATGVAHALAVASAPAASAAGEFCYDVDVVVNGDAVVDEQTCTPIG